MVATRTRLASIPVAFMFAFVTSDSLETDGLVQVRSPILSSYSMSAHSGEVFSVLLKNLDILSEHECVVSICDANTVQ